LVLVDVLLWAVVRGVVGAGAEPHVPGPGRVGGPLVAEHLDGLVGQVLRDVVALVRAVGLLGETVVLGQVREPLVGFAAEEAVEAVEALRERPLTAVGTRRNVLLGNVVVLAEPEGAEAVVLEDLSDGGALGGNAAAPAGESLGSLRNARAAVEVVV